MAGVVLAVRREFQRAWVEVLLVGLLLGAITTFALTAATGAGRAHTSWGRLVEAVEFPDVALQPATFSATRPLLDAVGADPDVAGATAMLWVPLKPAGGPVGAFAAFTPDFGNTVYRPVVVEGRLSEQSRPREVMATPELATILGAHIGDTIHLVSEDVGSSDVPASTVHFDEPVTLVGTVLGPIEVGPNGVAPTLWLTSSFSDMWLTTVLSGYPPALVESTELPLVMVRLRHGVERTSATDRLLKISPEGTSASDLGGLSEYTRDALDLVAWAYVGLAMAGAVTVLVLGAQSVARLTRRAGTPFPTLSALGMRSRHLRVVALAAPVAAIGLAGLVGLVGTYAASTLVPTGLARVVEPTPGHVADVLVLIPGVLAVVTGLGAIAVWTVRHIGTVDGSAPSTRPLPPVLAASPARAVGVRSGLGLVVDPSARRRARSSMATAVVGLFGLGAVVVLLTSGHRLLHDPQRYGYSFERAPALSDDTAESRRRRAAVAASAEFDAVAEVEAKMVPLSVGLMEVQSVQPTRGQVGWRIISGRAPSAPDDVVIGTVVAR
jgi:hypothetical protein